MINKIIEQVYDKSSIYYEIFLNIVGSDKDRDDLWQDIMMTLLKQPDKVIDSWKNNWFNYFFISIITNQFNSNSSYFYKNYKKTIMKDCKDNIHKVYDNIYNNNIDEKIEIKTKLEKLEKTINNINLTWIENELFNLYYKKGLTYREIEKIYDIDHVAVFLIVKRVKNKIKECIGI